MADQRQKIIDSVFSRRNASGSLEESYVSHVKIWEDTGEAGGRKPRYILLSQANNGSGFIHKSKLNTNGTFSVGKTWKLSELRAIQMISALSFNVTMSRTYKWQTENRDDQAQFVEALVRLFRTLSGSQASLHLDGVKDFEVPHGALQTSTTPREQPSRRPASPAIQAVRPQPSRSNFSEASERPPSPKPRSHVRNGSLGPRPSSPASSLRDRRPPSIVVPPPSTQYAPPPPQPQPPARRQISASDTPLRVPLPTSVEPSPARQPPQIQPERQRLPSRSANNASPTPSPRHQPPPIQPQRAEPSARLQPPPIEQSHSRREQQKARISFFDPSNQATLDRLILGSEMLEVDGEEENAQATLASVEEMIEGYEWASDDVIGRKMTKGAVDLIEARLLNELTALEKANIHSFLESDDRVNVVMNYMDNALAELENIDGLISSYKIHLSTVSDDILFIQSQNRGLQVQTQNQRALLGELQNLLRTVHVDQDALTTLTQESLEKAQSIQRLEEASVQLYKALQAGRDTEMAATMERLQEYRTYNSQFCKRMLDFLSIMFVAQCKMLLGDMSGVIKSSRPMVVPHRELEAYLGRYSGLMLYLREMDEAVYSKLCGAYFSAASDLHGTQIKALLSIHLDMVKRASDDESEQGAITSPVPSKTTAGIRRAGTIIRSPIEGRQKDKDKQIDGDQRASEVFGMFLEQIATLIYREDEFITDFLQINDAGLTFADYMGLDNYFRRQAARSSGLKQATLKLIRGALDLIFGFLASELKAWLDAALAKDTMELVGILAYLERFLVDAEEKGNPFVVSLLEKQHSRLRISFDRHVSDQLKGIEQTKLSSKKRKGVAQFIKNFPAYASRIENQLIGADSLDIRTNVDTAYERITQAMFDSLMQMAKLEGEGEDKGQLNYHVILIENMQYFVTEVSQMDVMSLNMATRKAEGMYDENLSSYIKIVFRRPFGKIIDFFEGVDRVAKGNPSELTGNSNFNKSALKKVVKDYNSKDIKKSVEALSKRVEKHFTEVSEKDDSVAVVSGKVLASVWKACEEEFLNLTETWSSRMSQLYGDSGVSLEYTVADVESAFRRQRLGS
ncbi:exocyst complex component Sec3-domain-containing protein [Crepidotus variabilis]|uniref:Exocyst complex component Sec3-domain-containing protein n=1 Tax=Crepidotus variabilis TaxID=179855 RepID=A0A9P6EE38_9AGAR|nr:exocyst complex component Sec3-domain-containing protein [Crepidotus variabilis]